jgi:ribosomal protein S18 acetylase RimI-like enzyme
MQKNQYLIRTMNRKEIDYSIEWAAKEGWNPGISDADCFHCADPNGFLVGILNNEPISTISVIKYGKSFGFLGFYIVKPEYRGKGYGFKIWKAGLNYLKGRNIGLDGVIAQQENYKKFGFKRAWRNIRYQGTGGGSYLECSEIIKLSELPFENIDSYDRSFFPAPRTQFLRSWLSQNNCDALGIKNNGRLAGYGVIRKCRSGYKIGPLFANTPILAEKLFLALKSRIAPGKQFYLDTPETNHEAISLAKRFKMEVVFETARMYSKEEPETKINQIFGITSFELG